MIKYKTEQVEKRVPEIFICDKCRMELKIGEDSFEYQETFSIKFTGGYNSVFGDGCSISCDLCQHCLKEMINNYYRILIN